MFFLCIAVIEVFMKCYYYILDIDDLVHIIMNPKLKNVRCAAPSPSEIFTNYVYYDNFKNLHDLEINKNIEDTGGGGREGRRHVSPVSTPNRSLIVI